MLISPLLNYRTIALLTAALFLCSCSTVRQIRPVDPGSISATASIGGPFVGQISWCPLPLISLAGNYGVIKNLDVELGWNATAALFGIMDLDLGVNYRPWLSQNWRPGLLLSAKGFLMTDFRPRNTLGYPDIGLTAFWQIHKDWYYYAGVENWFEYHSMRYDGNAQRYNWIPTIHTGMHVGNSKWLFQIEGKWYLPYADGTRHTVETVGSLGAFGLFLGLSRDFGTLPFLKKPASDDTQPSPENR
jgi:hypothetical protein